MQFMPFFPAPGDSFQRAQAGVRSDPDPQARFLTLQMEAGMRRPTVYPVLSRAQHTVGVKGHGGLGFPGQSLSCPLETE